MTVIHIPDYTDDNPYQKNLADALSEEVVFGEKDGFLPILRSVHSSGDITALHVHWLDPYIFASTKLRTVIQISHTIFQLFVLRSLGIPIVWTVHNVVSHESPHPKLERIFKHIFIRFGCSELFIHCEATKQIMSDEYILSMNTINEKSHIIEHGHYLNNYKNEVTKGESRTKLG
jgi:hypothetical protein